MKKEVARFMARCFDCQHVKATCKHPDGLLQLILIPEWKSEVISMDFMIVLPRKYRQQDSIMVIMVVVLNFLFTLRSFLDSKRVILSSSFLRNCLNF